MGYNGSNRLGYDRRYQGLKKSSYSVGNRLSKQINKFGLLMTGKFLFSDVTSANDILMGLAETDFTRSREAPSYLSPKKLTALVCSLLMLIPLLHWLCYYSHTHWGWWAFFSFLVFGTLSLLCIGLSERIIDTNAVISFKRWKVLGVIISLSVLVNIMFGLWAFWDSNIDFAYLFIIYQDLASFVILFYLHGAYTKRKQELTNKLY